MTNDQIITSTPGDDLEVFDAFNLPYLYAAAFGLFAPGALMTARLRQLALQTSQTRNR